MSLRLRAVLLAGVSLLVLWGAATAWMMRDVQSHLDQALDERLAMSARMVSGLLDRTSLRSGPVQMDMAPAFGDGGNLNQGIACEIRSLAGEVLAQTSSNPPSVFDDLPIGFSTRVVQGHPWRMYVLRTAEFQIATADRIDQRHVLIATILRAAGVPFLIAFLGGLAALWTGIGRGLHPLKSLSWQLRTREMDDTTPIQVRRPPQELRPVLAAMNGLLARLAQTLSSQRAFTDAAAHELRTPLTVIDTHLQVIRLTDGEQAEVSLRSAEEGVRRLRRTLEQMMTLARTEAVISQEDRCESVLDTVSGVLDALAPQDRQRVVFTSHDQDCATAVPRSMLATALRNLVDNALRYSPGHCQAEVHVHVDESVKRCLLSVADRGPGLDAGQVAQAARRFWRADQDRHRMDGAGLGLSIVQAIVQRFGGTLEFRSREGMGLVAVVSIPLETPAGDCGR
jgi:two-component system sensor histidine kinase QseC